VESAAIGPGSFPIDHACLVIVWALLHYQQRSAFTIGQLQTLMFIMLVFTGQANIYLVCERSISGNPDSVLDAAWHPGRWHRRQYPRDATHPDGCHSLLICYCQFAGGWIVYALRQLAEDPRFQTRGRRIKAVS
jgi:hypothetical protein